jgi:hypothetical protein
MQPPLCGDAEELQLPQLWLGEPAVQQVNRALLGRKSRDMTQWLLAPAGRQHGGM